MIIGLTGRVGVGKSTAAKCVQSHFDIQVIDLDLVGHHVLKIASVINLLTQTFGSRIVDQSEQINRAELGKIVFSDRLALSKLNKIVHPIMKNQVLDTLSTSDGHWLIVGSLIDEIGLRYVCDSIIVIDADDKTIKAKIGDKSKIMIYQRSKEQYLQSADAVIHNHFDASFKPTVIDIFSQTLSS